MDYLEVVIQTTCIHNPFATPIGIMPQNVSSSLYKNKLVVLAIAKEHTVYR